MKKLYLFLFCGLFCTANLNAQLSGGSGTASDPFLISSRADMESVIATVNSVNNWSQGRYFLLTQDITEVITITMNGFRGTFNGNGHSININSNSGLFGSLHGATIKNLNVTGRIISDRTNVIGGIANTATNSTITNCSNRATISFSNFGFSAVGGIVGQASNSIITNSSNTGGIFANSTHTANSTHGNVDAGGIVGRADAATAITNSFNRGTVSGTRHNLAINTHPRVGGISGHGGRIINCIAVNATIITNWGEGARIANGAVVENSHALASMQINGTARSSQYANSRDGRDINDNLGNIFNNDFSTCSHSVTTIMLNTTNTVRWQRSNNNGQTWTNIDHTLFFYTETDLVAGEYIYRALNGDGTWSNQVRGRFYNAVPSNISTLSLASVEKRVGESITFSLDLADNNYNFQWYRGDVPISGATSSTFSIPALRMSDAGVYHCRVWNGCNEVLSSNTMLIMDRGLQTITLPETTMTKGYGEEDFYLPEFTNQNLPITYTSSNPSVATVTGNSVQIVGLGTTTITATQAGNSEFLSATPITMSLTVVRGQQTIIFNALSEKTFGDVPFVLTASVSSNGTITYESSNTNVATISGNMLTIHNAGTVTITAFANGNEFFHDANPVQQQLTVNRAILTATANNKSRLYGERNPVFTITYSGFRNSDNESSLTQVPTVSSVAMPTSVVGDYPITLTGGSARNYDFVLVDGTLTINRATVTITAQSVTSVYGDALPVFTAIYTGFANNETEAVLTVLPTLTTTASSASGVGAYSIIPSGAEAQNYNFIYQNGTLTIERRPLQVIPNDAVREYGDPNPVFMVSLTGFVNNDDESVIITRPTASTTATQASAVGTYTITSSGGNAANYSFVHGTCTLTITQAPLTITANNVTRPQGEPNPVFTLSFSGFKNNENYTVLDELPVASSIADENSIPGFYEIVLSGGSDRNYVFKPINGTLEVTTASNLNNISETNIQIFPNPVTHELHIINHDWQVNDVVELFDISGRLVFSERIHSHIGEFVIDMSPFQAGSYILRIGNHVAKVVKR